MKIIMNGVTKIVPDIGDTIYRIRPHINHYEYDPLKVDQIHIYKDDIVILANFPLGMKMKALGRDWFRTEEDAKWFCKNNTDFD